METPAPKTLGFQGGLTHSDSYLDRNMKVMPMTKRISGTALIRYLRLPSGHRFRAKTIAATIATTKSNPIQKVPVLVPAKTGLPCSALAIIKIAVYDIADTRTENIIRFRMLFNSHTLTWTANIAAIH